MSPLIKKKFHNVFLYFALAIYVTALVLCIRCSSQPENNTHNTQISTIGELKSAYAGDAACIDCHRDIYDQYQLTGKGQSFRKPEKGILPFELPASVVYDTYSDLYYQAHWQKEGLWIHEYKLIKQDTIHSRWQKVDYIIGSGNQTMSFLYEEKGYFYEIPITWYAGKKLWDMSPG